MQVKNKRVLKNGAIGGYVRQSDGSYKWRIIGHVKKKGGDLTENDDKILQSQHSKLLEFLDYKIKHYGLLTTRRRHKQRFEEWRNNLRGNNDPDAILGVINGIVNYYNEGNSKNLGKQFLEKYPRVYKFFTIYNKVKGINDIDLLGDLQTQFLAWGERKGNTTMPNNNKGRSQAKKLGSKKRADLMAGLLGGMDKAGKKKVKELLVLINKIPGNNNKWDLEVMIFDDGKSVTEVRLRLDGMDVPERTIDKIVRLYSEVRGKIANHKRELENQVRTVNVRNTSNRKNDSVKKQLQNNKTLSSNERKEVKKYKFDIIKDLKTMRDRELYIKIGGKILTQKYYQYMGQNNPILDEIPELEIEEQPILNFENLKAKIENHTSRRSNNKERNEYEKLVRQGINYNEDLAILRAERGTLSRKTNRNILGETNRKLKALKNKQNRYDLLHALYKGEKRKEFKNISGKNGLDNEEERNLKKRLNALDSPKQLVLKRVNLTNDFNVLQRLKNKVSSEEFGTILIEKIEKNLEKLKKVIKKYNEIKNQNNKKSKLLKTAKKINMRKLFLQIEMYVDETDGVVQVPDVVRSEKNQIANNIRVINSDLLKPHVAIYKNLGKSHDNLINLRIFFLIETFKSLLCAPNDDNDCVRKYIKELNQNNLNYTKIMKQAAKIDSSKLVKNKAKEKEINFKMYFIYNQIRNKKIMEEDFDMIVKMAEECNKELIKEDIARRRRRTGIRIVNNSNGNSNNIARMAPGVRRNSRGQPTLYKPPEQNAAQVARNRNQGAQDTQMPQQQTNLFALDGGNRRRKKTTKKKTTKKKPTKKKPTKKKTTKKKTTKKKTTKKKSK